MNSEPCRFKACNVLAILGAFLIVAFLVALMRHYTATPSLAAERGIERLKIRAQFDSDNAVITEKYDWQDKDRDIVRVPVLRAKELVLEEWQSPAAARSNLMDRAAKAFAPLPKPPEKKSVYE